MRTLTELSQQVACQVDQVLKVVVKFTLLLQTQAMT